MLANGGDCVHSLVIPAPFSLDPVWRIEKKVCIYEFPPAGVSLRFRAMLPHIGQLIGNVFIVITNRTVFFLLRDARPSSF